MSDTIGLLANLALALSFIVGLVFGIQQVRAAARDRRERLTVETLATYQSREFTELMYWILNHEVPATRDALRAMPPSDQVMLMQLSQEMESLGIVVAEQMISIDLVDKALGSFVTMSWAKYKPLFEEVRLSAPDPFLGEYFQWLAERIDERMVKQPRRPFHLTAMEEIAISAKVRTERVGQSMIQEFDLEMASTRRLLERVPGDKGEWRPHPKSFPLGHLAQLVTWMPGWIANALEEDSLDLATAPKYSFEPTAALLAAFDANVKQAREAFSRVSDAAFDASWSLKNGAATLWTSPRRVIVRNHLNHLVHHRGQLTVYLRLIDVPLPPIYGPTADERTF